MTKKIIGIIIIIFGCILLLSNLEIITLENIWSYLWPAGLLVIGSVGLFERRAFDFFSSALVFIGLLFFLRACDVVNLEIVKLIIGPVLLIGIGVSLLVNYKNFVVMSDKSKKYLAIFSGVEEVLDDKKYKSSEAVAVFGGIELDYRNVKFESKTAYINVIAVFGGVDLRVADNVRVITKGIPIFGGCENKARVNEYAEYELIVNYSVAFGGIEIKN